MPENPTIQRRTGAQAFTGSGNNGQVEWEDLRRLPRGVGICCKYIVYRQEGAALTSVRLVWDVPSSEDESDITLLDVFGVDILEPVTAGWSFVFRNVRVPRHLEPDMPDEDGFFAKLKFTTDGKDGDGTFQVYWETLAVPERVPGVQMTTNPRQHATP